MLISWSVAPGSALRATHGDTRLCCDTPSPPFLLFPSCQVLASLDGVLDDVPAAAEAMMDMRKLAHLIDFDVLNVMYNCVVDLSVMHNYAFYSGCAELGALLCRCTKSADVWGGEGGCRWQWTRIGVKETDARFLDLCQLNQFPF